MDPLAQRLQKMRETIRAQGDKAHELARPSNPASPKPSKVEEVALLVESVAGSIQMVVDLLIEAQGAE